MWGLVISGAVLAFVVGYVLYAVMHRKPGESWRKTFVRPLFGGGPGEE